MDALLADAAARAARYLDGLGERKVAPSQDAIDRLRKLGDLPAGPTDPHEMLALLDDVGSPATVATAGPRFFGFVIGGSLPPTVAAHWLATAWDQNAYSWTSSPASAALEEIALRWVLDVLGFPSTHGGGFVTGATMGNFACLAAARRHLLLRAGWDVDEQGLAGAPPLRVVVGEEVHPSLLKALGLLGFGRSRVERVPVDDQGRLRVGALPPLDARTILCLQAGNVNTGAFDPIAPAVVAAEAAGAWVHVDGAFGLWAAAAPGRRHLVASLDRVDSCSVDAHKWLNVPYDSGIAITRHPEALRGAMAVHASYLPEAGRREPADYTPEMSRRARGVDVWAAMRTLGRSGLADLVERDCRLATRMADALRREGLDVLNDVVLNQVLVSFGSPEATLATVRRLQEDGTAWCGSTVWQGRTAMRISVSSWATTEEDADRAVAAIVRAARS